MTSPGRYTCEETFRRLDDFLDRELTAREQQLVTEHLALCAVCAQEFRFEASLLQSVRGKLRQIALPESLRTRVLALLADERSAGGHADGD